MLNDENVEVIDNILNNSKATKLIAKKQIDKIMNKGNIKLLTKITEINDIWGQKYPHITQSWTINWTELTTFF